MLHHIPSHHPILSAFNEVPSGSRLQHVTELGDDTRHVSQDDSQPTKGPLYVHWGRAPPVPPRLVKRIQDGRFIDMAEILSTNLSSAQSAEDEQPSRTKNKYQEVTNIVRWLQCFGIYLAVISWTEPHRTLDLLGYQNLGYLNYPDGRWVMYDRQFHQKTSATLVPEWSAIDTTLWNLAFSSHATGHYDNTPQEATYKRNDSSQAYRISWKPLPKKQHICLEWNDTPSKDCSHPAC